MEKVLRLSAEQRDDLCAYLDGELPDQQSQQIDAVLASSAVARHEVEALARTWEMLDLLPTPKASEEFTSRTMTNLKVAELPFEVAEQPWYPHVVKYSKLGFWLVLIGLAGWIGYQITAKWIPNDHDQLLEDLPVLRELDSLQDADSIEFLEALKKGQVFDEGVEKP